MAEGKTVSGGENRRETPTRRRRAQPWLTPNNIGICRIAFSVDDIDRTYADLQAKKVQFVAPLKKIKGPDDATRLKPCRGRPGGSGAGSKPSYG
jgi:hypothetical protein